MPLNTLNFAIKKLQLFAGVKVVIILKQYQLKESKLILEGEGIKVVKSELLVFSKQFIKCELRLEEYIIFGRKHILIHSSWFSIINRCKALF